MPLEVSYSFKKFRPCEWVPSVWQIYGSGEVGEFDMFSPAKIEAVSSAKEEVGNIFVEQNGKRLWGELMNPDGSSENLSFSTPILLREGQVLRLRDRTRSMSMALTDCTPEEIMWNGMNIGEEYIARSWQSGNRFIYPLNRE